MQFTTHILLSNKQVVGSWTFPSDIAVESEPTHCTWVEDDQLYVNIYRTENLTNGLHQFQQRLGASVIKWLKAQMPDTDFKPIGGVEWLNGEMLVAGLRYPELTEHSWASMPQFVLDSQLDVVTPLWLSQFGTIVEREQLSRGNRIECVYDDKVAEVHGRYGALVHYHGSIDKPREHFGQLITDVLGKSHGYFPLPGTPIYTGYATPLQYTMYLSHKAHLDERRKQRS